MTYEFGDKILYDGNPGIFLYRLECWSSEPNLIYVKAGQENPLSAWVADDELASYKEADPEPQKTKLPHGLREQIAFVHGQLSILQCHADQDVSEVTTFIMGGYERIAKMIYPDYGN